MITVISNAQAEQPLCILNMMSGEISSYETKHQIYYRVIPTEARRGISSFDNPSLQN
jgi:hypothetical protein